MEYDVIVVGAGPAGCAAAKAAAERGAKTILLEEHPQIGLPQHCTGRLHGTRSGVGKDILRRMDPRVVLSEAKVRRIFSPKGRIWEIPLEGMGAYIIDRALFDMELAIQAAHAGAEISVNTKVTGLLTSEGRVNGVRTRSTRQPEFHGKVVIASDGIRSMLNGIPKWAGLVQEDLEILTGMTWWLTGVTDIEPGVLELHLGDFGGKRGWIWLECYGPSRCVADFLRFEDWKRCKEGDSRLSRKIRDANPLRMTGWSHPLYIGKLLSKKVQSGLILAGAAAGYHPFLTCLLSGRYAGETAAEAAKEQNVTEERLAVYDILCHTLKESRKINFGSFLKLSEEKQEELFEKMTRMGDLDFDVLAL